MSEQETKLAQDGIQETLDRRAEILAKRMAKKADESEGLQLTAFTLGRERYGIDVTLVQEAQPLARLNWSRVPCTPDFVLGAVSIRGRIYSLMDLGRFLGLPPRPLPDTAHVLLVRGSNRPDELAMELSILADDVPEVINVNENDLQPAAETVPPRVQEFVRGVRNDLLVVIGLKRLLSDRRMIVHEEVGSDGR